MNPLVIGNNYCLRLPDGRALGHVRIERFEDDWAEGHWRPTPEFEEVRSLFDREARLRNDQIIPLWETAMDAIEALHIQVVEEGSKVVTFPLRICVEGEDAILGPPSSIGD